ncbi:glycoside hydrolase superfamily [Lipomyces doorenjongii]
MVSETYISDSWVESTFARLTLAEKSYLISGDSMWNTYAIPRLGVPAIKFTDGPIAARGSKWIEGVTAAICPSTISMAATWDCESLSKIGRVLAEEARSKRADLLLGPTVCINRSPLGGRNFESFGEDPYLNGTLAASYIDSIQERGVGTCLKHYVCNDQETDRFVVDCVVSERALREIHLRPFEIAIRQCKEQPWSVMAAYNKLNGVYCSRNKYLLENVLRKSWGFNGVTMSDWHGTNSIVPSVEAGLDLEMPGPTKRRGQFLIDAFELGHIKEKTIDECARRVLELIYKTGKVGRDFAEEKEIAIVSPIHSQILREVASDGIVLLKNSKQHLPLPSQVKKVAVIGPNAAVSVANGGGSSAANPHYRTDPFNSIRQALPNSEVRTTPGCRIDKFVTLIKSECMTNPVTGGAGIHIDYYRDLNQSGDTIFEEDRTSSMLSMYDTLPRHMARKESPQYSYRARTIVRPMTSGKHKFSISSCGNSTLYIDGKEVTNIVFSWRQPRSELFMAYGSPEKVVEVDGMEAGRAYEVMVEGISKERAPNEVSWFGDMVKDELMDGIRLGFQEEERVDLLQEAKDLASDSDVVILVVGKNSEWESETYDMKSMDLPGKQNTLVEEILDINPNTVVVIQTGSPVSMPWIDQTPTVVQAWYQGLEQGNALCDVLFGRTNPSGKLPMTIPKKLKDTPCYHNFPGENKTVVYGEGIFVGYRHYDAVEVNPLFEFGYGLSYTTFGYSDLRLSSPVFTESIEVTVNISNTGSVPGKEVVQFYVAQTSAHRIPRPVRELKGFNKVFLEPGETKLVSAIFTRDSVGFWDTSCGAWVVDAGSQFELLVGASSRDIRLVESFKVVDRLVWV